MSYRHYVSKRGPVGLWMLDDSAPFQEHTGMGLSADIRAGSTARATSHPLVSGAAYSSVFGNPHQAEFTSPVFKQGQEDRPFALEAWICPIRPTKGVTQEVKNIASNPSGEVNTSSWQPYNSAVLTSSAVSYAVHGTRVIRALASASGVPAHGNFTMSYPNSDGALPNTIYSVRVKYRLATGTAANVDFNPQIITYKNGAGTGVATGGTITRSGAASTSGWTDLIMENWLTPNVDLNMIGVMFRPNVALVSGEGIEIDSIIITATTTAHEYFDGNSPGAVWNGTPNNSASRLLVSEGPQKILSHAGAYDGITIEGNTIKFATEYLTAGRAECSYTMPFSHAAHIVGHHGPDENSLYVNGELVSSVLLTDEQKVDKYVATDGKLYSGQTTSSQQFASNGFAVYVNMPHDTIAQNFDAGRAVVSTADIAPQFEGLVIDVDYRMGSAYLEQEWSSPEDFYTGYVQDVAIGDESVLPHYVDGLSVPGSLTLSTPLDDDLGTSIYGVMVEWSGRGVTLEASTDGVTWATLTNGRLAPVVPNGMNPTGVDFEVRVSFAGGLAEDPAFLDSLKVVAFRDNIINISESRKGSLAYPAVPLEDYSPIEFRSNNGIALGTGSVTINPDDDPEAVFQTVEVWVKHGGSKPTINLTPTAVYALGQPGGETIHRPGEWVLTHYVLSAPTSTAITISGDCIVGQIVTYPTALTQADIEYIYKSYGGVPVIKIDDSSTIAVLEPATPYALYTHDWSIDGAGG